MCPLTHKVKLCYIYNNFFFKHSLTFTKAKTKPLTFLTPIFFMKTQKMR